MHIFSSFFPITVSLFFYLAFLCFLLNPVHLFPSSICFLPPSTPPPHSSFSLCLPQTSGCISPPAGCMTGEQVERRANDKSLSSRPFLHLSLPLAPSHPLSCQRPSLAFLPPSFQHLPILSDHIDIQICPGCIPPSPDVKVSQKKKNIKRERRWANVPTLILNPQLDIYK